MDWKNYGTPIGVADASAHGEILARIPPGSEVLDVGCAEGFFAQVLGKRARVWGIDGNPAAAAVARTRCVDTLTVDLNATPEPAFDGRLFDVVVFADVLEHLVSSVKILTHYARQVKDGGSVIVSLPNIAHWRFRLMLLFGRFRYSEYGVMDNTHLRFFTFTTGRELVREAGLEIVEIRGVGQSKRLGRIVPFLGRLDSLFAPQMLIVARKR